MEPTDLAVAVDIVNCAHLFTSDIHHIDVHDPLLLTSLPGNKSWANPPESCDVYEDQKAGKYDNSAPYANTGESV